MRQVEDSNQAEGVTMTQRNDRTWILGAIVIRAVCHSHPHRTRRVLAADPVPVQP
jgi:hypothetical protein